MVGATLLESRPLPGTVKNGQPCIGAIDCISDTCGNIQGKSGLICLSNNPPPNGGSNGGSNIWIYVIIIVGVIMLVLGGILFYMHRKNKIRRREYFSRHTPHTHHTHRRHHYHHH